MDTKKRNYRAECLEVMNLPEGTPDSVILKNLQSLMAQWHPDRSNFTDNEARRKAEDYYKKGKFSIEVQKFEGFQAL